MIGELLAANPGSNNGIGALGIGGLPPEGSLHVAMHSGYGAPPIGDRLGGGRSERVVTVTVRQAGDADRRVLQAAGGRLRQCIAEAVAADPSVSGTTTLTISVTATGSVRTATSTTAGIPQTAVACTAAVGRALSFPADGERVVRVAVTAAPK